MSKFSKNKMQEMLDLLSGKKKSDSNSRHNWFKGPKELGEKKKIRFLPAKDESSFWLSRASLHYRVGKKGEDFPFLCPRENFGEECPVCQKGFELFNFAKENGNDEKIKNMAKAFLPKERFYAPVVDLADQEAGTAYYSFSKTIANKLMDKFSDEDWGDFTDWETGRTATLTVTEVKNFGGGPVPITDIDLSPKTSRFCEDEEERGEFMAGVLEDPNELHNRLTSEQVEERLEAMLERQANSLASLVAGEEDGEEEVVRKSSVKDIMDKASQEDDDDLPF